MNTLPNKLLLWLCLCLAGVGQLAQAQSGPVLAKNETVGQKPKTGPRIALADALEQLKTHYQVSFFYNPDNVQGRSVPVPELPKRLETALGQLLGPLGLTYKHVEKNVYVITEDKHAALFKRKVVAELPSPAATSLPATTEVAGLPALELDLKANRRITGKVTDAETNMGLPGVNVLVKGTLIGTVSDVDGKFALTVPNGSNILVFSYVGYTSQEVTIGESNVLTVSLSPDVKSLKEVVVIGYGEQKREDVTGSIASIKAQDLKTVPMAGVDQLMQGRASGVMVTQNTGQPGGGVSVRIRGITSLTGNNEPLYVIDGVPFTGEGGQSQGFSTFGGGGGQTSQSILSSINPADIVSVDVLKDASATAIYGSRASNGVVIITTKRGKANDSKISYDTYYGVQRVPKFLPVMNLQEYASYANQIAREYQLPVRDEFKDPSLLGPGTDWQREVFRPAPISSHQLGISGGKEKTQFFVSAGYFKQEGIVIGSNFDRLSARLNLDNQTKDWLKIGTSLTVSRTKQKITLTDDENGVVSAALLQGPQIPVRYPDGSWGGPEDVNAGLAVNPVAMALLRDVNRVQNRFLGNLFAEATLYKGLTLRSSLGGDINYTENSAYNPTYQWGAIVNTQNKFVRGTSQSIFWMWQNYLTYNTQFGQNHKLNVMVGHEAMKSTWDWITGSRTGFFSNDVQALSAGTANTATNENGKGASTLESVFARGTYNYSDRYSLTFTYRVDGSSKFGPDNRWGKFPAAAAAWTISNEAFLKNHELVSNLKLRLGYGVVGNQNIMNYAFGAALKPVITAWGTGFFADKIPNPAVRWEAATQANLGVDFGLLDDRVNLTVDVYNKISKDFLYQLPLPAYTGAGTNWDDIQAPFVNLGRMQNRGIDLSLNSRNITTERFSWNTTLILSSYRNKILELVDEGSAIFRNVQWFNTVTRSAVGQPVGLFYGYQTDGIFGNLDDLNAAPRQSDKLDQFSGTWLGDIRFRNLDETATNGRQVIDGRDRTTIGNPHPKFTFGFTNNFTFKNFDLSIFLQGVYGNSIFNFTRRYTEGLNGVFNNQLRRVATDRWSAANPEGTLPRMVLGDPNGNTRVSDRFIEDGSFLRVQNLSLGYNLPAPLAQRLRLSRLRVYAMVQNLKTFTRYSGFDPELGAYNQDALLMSVDNGHYPNPRSYTMGINVEF